MSVPVSPEDRAAEIVAEILNTPGIESEDDLICAVTEQIEAILKPQVEALDIILRFGGADGAHHKQWVLDEVVKALAGDNYDQWVASYNNGVDGPETYHWDRGIAP